MKTCFILLCLLLLPAAASLEPTVNAPTELNGTWFHNQGSSYYILLSWTDNSDNEVGFELQGALRPPRGEWQEMHDIIGYPANTTFTKFFGNPRYEYRFRIRAVTETEASDWTPILEVPAFH